MDATCAIQNSIHVFSLVHINMCPGFWVHINLRGFIIACFNPARKADAVSGRWMTIRCWYVPDRTDIQYWKLSHTAYRTLYIHCCHSGFADTVRYQKLSTRRHCSGTDGICHHCHSQLYRYFHNRSDFRSSL